MRESRESSRFLLNRKPSSVFFFLAPNSTFFVLFSANFANVLKIRRLHSFFFNFSGPNSFSVHSLSEFHDSSVNSFSFSRLHSLKVLPYLSSVTSYVICKAILFLPPLLCHVVAPLRNLPGTVFLKSVFLPSYLPYVILLQVLSHSSPPFCPSSAVHSCTCTLALLNNSWLSLC